MAVLPRKNVDRITFCENHIGTWTTNATAIGTTTAAVTDLDTKTQAARAALTAQQLAEAAAKDATINLRVAMTAMTDAAADIIKGIKFKAATAGDSVYALASIPVPATPSAVGPPGLPFDFKAALKPNGALELKWKCNNPAGCDRVIYQLYRREETDSEFTYIGGAGQREYTDEEVPRGAASLIYKIQGTRSTAVGDEAEFIVNFGTTSSGGTEISSVTAAPKMAA